MKTTLSERDATVYQYRLVKRWAPGSRLTILYWSISGCFAAAIVIGYGLGQLIALLCAVLVTQLLQYGFLRLLLSFQDIQTSGKWRAYYLFPWFSYLPKHLFSIAALWHTHLQQSIVVLVIIGCLYPWTTSLFIGMLLFAHGWSVLPRLIMFQRMQRLAPHGIAKVTAADISLFLT